MTPFELYVQDLPGLQAWIRLDETSGDAVDSSGNLSAGTVGAGVTQGVAGLLTGSSNRAASFSGSSTSSISFGDVLAYERTDAFAYSFWFKPPAGALAADKPILTKLDAGGTFRGYEIQHNSDGTVDILIYSTAGSNGIRVTTTAPVVVADTAAMYHMDYNGSSSASGVRLFVNGVAAALSATQNNLTDTIVQAGVHLCLGNRDLTVAGAPGVIDEVVGVNRVWSGTEVEAMYRYATTVSGGFRSRNRNWRAR